MRDAASRGRPAWASRPALNSVGATPLPEMVDAGRRIARAAGLDICGIEYLVDERDGAPSVYDINALSNFVADAPRIIGFDPFERFATYIEGRLETSTAHSVPAPVRSKGQ